MSSYVNDGTMKVVISHDKEGRPTSVLATAAVWTTTLVAAADAAAGRALGAGTLFRETVSGGRRNREYIGPAGHEWKPITPAGAWRG